MKGYRISLAIMIVVLAGLLISPCMGDMQVVAAGPSGSSKTALISDYASMKTIKQDALSGYTLAWKPDISAYSRDTTIYTDPALIASWTNSAKSVSSGSMSSYGMFVKKISVPCGCGGCG